MGTERNWGQLVRACALLSAAIALGRGLALMDRESIAIGVALSVATGLTFSGRPLLTRLGWIGTAALFVNQAVWMVGATVALASAAPSTFGAAVPAVLAVAALTGLLASVARVRTLAPRAVLPTGVGALVLALGLTIAVPIAGADAVRGEANDLQVTTSDLAFEPANLTADAGDVGVVVKNDDLFWHTFTVNELNESVSVATGGRKRLELHGVAPGTYHVVCAIPGHEGAGMKGLLVVR